jgi:hypothetical protein
VEVVEEHRLTVQQVVEEVLVELVRMVHRTHSMTVTMEEMEQTEGHLEIMDGMVLHHG